VDRAVGDDAALEVQGNVTGIGEEDSQEQEEQDAFVVRVPEVYNFYLVPIFHYFSNLMAKVNYSHKIS